MLLVTGLFINTPILKRVSYNTSISHHSKAAAKDLMYEQLKQSLTDMMEAVANFGLVFVANAEKKGVKAVAAIRL